MTPYRLQQIASAGVLCEEELEAEADKVEHTCWRNGGVECWQCERQEAIEEAKQTCHATEITCADCGQIVQVRP